MATLERVLLAGASGDTGQEVLGVLSATNLTVRALTRSPEKERRLRRLGADEVMIGDLYDKSDATRAVKGADAVLTTVGMKATEVWTAAKYVDDVGNTNLLEAAEEAVVTSFVMESSLGVGDDRESLMANAFRIVLHPVIEAKGRAEDAIRESELRYTIFRPGILVGGFASGDVQIADAGTGLWGITSRRDIARHMVASLYTPEAAGRTFEIVRNPLLAGRSLDIDWSYPG